MAYSKAEFAALVGMESRKLSIYIGRNKVVVDKKSGLIDMTNEANKAFAIKHGPTNSIKQNPDNDLLEELEGYAPATAPKAKPKLKLKPPPGISKKEYSEFDDWEDGPVEDGDIPKLFESEKAFKFYQSEKYRVEHQLKQLELEKKMGMLIPTELVSSVIAQQSKSFSAAFRQALERAVDLLVIRYKLTGPDAADLRKKVTETVNKAITDSTNESKRQVKKIVAEFTEKRTASEEN